jgi:hypothetical protein
MKLHTPIVFCETREVRLMVQGGLSVVPVLHAAGLFGREGDG